jgi:hypothetical protein
MIYETTRSITFGMTNRDKVRTNQQTLPAGTLVYAEVTDYRDQIKLRVAGTLLTQIVERSAIKVGA